MSALPLKTVTPLEIKAIKRRAKQLTKQLAEQSGGEGPAKSYMQCLDIICQEEMGLRHFHEAQKLASQRVSARSAAQSSSQSSESPWTLYLQACQDSYFEI